MCNQDTTPGRKCKKLKIINKHNEETIDGDSKGTKRFFQGHGEKPVASTKRPRYRPPVWFDDVPDALIKSSLDSNDVTATDLVKPNSFSGQTKAVAIDCEFVGVGFGGKENALARVSIVNQFGNVLMDQYVRPREPITNYRTSVSGITPALMRRNGPAKDFETVQKSVAKILEGRILVGHAVHHDLKVLMLSHPKKHIRDTASYKPFRALFNDRTPSLKALTERILRVQVQSAEHDSVEDARATMRLYTTVKRIWEAQRKAQRAGKSSKDIRKLAAHLNIPTEVDNGAVGASLADDSSSDKLKFTSLARIALDTCSEFASGLTPNPNSSSNYSRTASRTEALPTACTYLGPKPKSRARVDLHGRKCSKRRSAFLEKRNKIRQRKKMLSSSSTFLH